MVAMARTSSVSRVDALRVCSDRFALTQVLRQCFFLCGQSTDLVASRSTPSWPRLRPRTLPASICAIAICLRAAVSGGSSRP